MDYGGARVLSAAFRAVGIDSRVVPPSNAYSNSLGGRCTSGDECYPTKITLGDFLAVLERGDVKPENAAFFMATADGPCRFGQYHPFMRRTLDELGYKDIPLFSLTSRDAYHGMGNGFELNVWRGIVAVDILRKWLHMTRPYEREAGATDRVYEDTVKEICRMIEQGSQGEKLVHALKAARSRFDAIAVYKKGTFPLIGVLGEIFCRLNTFSNQDLIRKFEEHGAECWLVGISEWILYTNADEIRRLKEKGQYFTRKFLKAVIKRFILKREEHKILKHFARGLKGREECDVNDLLKLSLSYLPWHGSLGEMTLSAAGAVYFHKKGCKGVVDISSFACMNEIVAEAVFPRISRDLGNFPIKVFYFDGTSQNLDRDIEIFLELARNYGRKSGLCG
jgi:predicted nucleotide-binding protein (sugar kinase/HSP70/actin superfamily)